MEKENQIEKEKTNKQVVKTYAEDMAKALEHSQGGLIKKIIEEQEEKQKEEAPTNKKNITLTLGAFLLIFLSVILFLVFNFLQEKKLTIEPKFTPVIFLDKTNLIDISNFSKEKIKQIVFSQANSAIVSDKEIQGFYLTYLDKILGFKDLMKIINADISLDKFNFLYDNFLIGVSGNLNQENDLFFLAQMRSMNDIFEGMKLWEESIIFDLGGFFGLSSQIDNDFLSKNKFENDFILNKNARILKNELGEIIFMYVYLNDNSILFTNSEEIVQEISSRITSGKLKQ